MDKRKIALNVLRYWHLVEFLSQLSFPAESRENKQTLKKAAEGDERIRQITLYRAFDAFSPGLVDVIENDALSYVNYPEISEDISICFGQICRADCVEYLRKRFGKEVFTPEEDLSVISLFGFKCDAEGFYVERSMNVSDRKSVV